MRREERNNFDIEICAAYTLDFPKGGKVLRRRRQLQYALETLTRHDEEAEPWITLPTIALPCSCQTHLNRGI